jgi:hypothetical protein
LCVALAESYDDSSIQAPDQVQQPLDGKFAAEGELVTPYASCVRFVAEFKIHEFTHSGLSAAKLNEDHPLIQYGGRKPEVIIF